MDIPWHKDLKKIRLLPSTDVMDMREYKSLELSQYAAISHLVIKKI